MQCNDDHKFKHWINAMLLFFTFMVTLWIGIHSQKCTHLSLIGNDEFEQIFNPDAGDVFFGVSALQCIYRCHLVGYHINVAIYSLSDSWCSCRESYSVNTVGQKNIDVIELNRASMYPEEVLILSNSIVYETLMREVQLEKCTHTR